MSSLGSSFGSFPKQKIPENSFGSFPEKKNPSLQYTDLTNYGDVTPNEVLSGDTFSGNAYINSTGTMPNNTGDVAAISSHSGGAGTIHVIPAAGYTNGTTDASIITDADFVEGKIKAGVNIFGVTGTYETPLTGDAVVGNVLATKTFYKDDATTKLTGTMIDNTGAGIVYTPGISDQAVGIGYFGGVVGDGKIKGDAKLVTGNIKSGISIFGVSGKTEIVDTTEVGNPAAVGDVAQGKIFFVNGVKYTGTKV